jgi:S1-C subfamily serine protease
MRISYDGRRLTTLSPTSRLAKYAAYNPMDLKAPLTSYDVAAVHGNAASGTDLAFHPLLPIAAIIGAGSVEFFDSESGSSLSVKEQVEIPDLATSRVRRAMFSADGKHLVVLESGSGNEYTLVRASLPLTDAEQTAMRKRAASSTKTVKASAVPLSELTAWRGGLSKTATTAQIAANYSDSVVIVRSGNSTGTGFIVGSSGLILTAAHCVSPLESVQVVYHPQGKSEEKLTADANVVHRDRKTDMALLKIDVKHPLHSVVLADPIDVKSGEEVTIIANPGLGDEVLDNTVTTGIISNVKRMIAGNPYIQSSAAVNPGSSGGPMFDHNGQVIGLVVLKAGIEGVGFAVPAAPIAKFLLKATRRDGDRGHLERHWVDSGLKTEIPGQLVGIKSDSVTLTDNGQTQTHSISDFSPGDQKLLSLLATEE